MRNELFNKHYTKQAEKACTDTIKDAYSAILDIAFEQIAEIEPEAQDKDMRLKHIRANAFQKVSKLSQDIKTNMPIEFCEYAVLNAVDEMIAEYKANIATAV